MNKELILKCIYENPLVLLAFKNQESIDYINSFLPYSTGFEIECNKLLIYDKKNFASIPNILDVNPSDNEQRFRIPNGIRGFICLYFIAQALKTNCSLNTGSGVHYHVDCVDIFKDMNNDTFIAANNDWIIEELIEWKTALDINSHNAKCSQGRAWVRYAYEHRTIEIRIGEMSFEYEVLVKRIIDSNRIVKKLKGKLLDSKELEDRIKFSPIDTSVILKYLKESNLSGKEKEISILKNKLEEKKKELSKFLDTSETQTSLEDIKRTVSSRVKKFI